MKNRGHEEAVADAELAVSKKIPLLISYTDLAYVLHRYLKHTITYILHWKHTTTLSYTYIWKRTITYILHWQLKTYGDYISYTDSWKHITTIYLTLISDNVLQLYLTLISENVPLLISYTDIWKRPITFISHRFLKHYIRNNTLRAQSLIVYYCIINRMAFKTARVYLSMERI